MKNCWWKKKSYCEKIYKNCFIEIEILLKYYFFFISIFLFIFLLYFGRLKESEIKFN